MKKNLTLLFNHFEKEHLGKDVFLVPYYLGKQYNYAVTIVYPRTKTNKNLPSNINGVNLIPIHCIGNSQKETIADINLLRYLFTHAKKIDCLMRFHSTHLTALTVCIYKLLNPSGKVYIKMDIDPRQINLNYIQKASFTKKISAILYKYYTQGINTLSCETSLAYKTLMQATSFHYNYKNKLTLMPNGFDEEALKALEFKEYSFIEKENIIISVGRLGTPPKNTELFLQSLAHLDLKNWKVYLIGPIHPDFQIKIDTFYQQYPDKKNQVIFTGAIYNKKELWSYYNKAKVFVLTSRWESYALVLNEAKRFRNYIISTNVGAASDLIEDNKYGKIIKQDSPTELANTLKEIINNQIDIDVYANFSTQSLSWSEMIRKIHH